MAALTSLLRRPAAVDVLAACAAFGTTVALLAHEGAPPLHPAVVALAGGASLPLLLGRRFPVGVLVVTTLACAGLSAPGRTVDLAPGPAVAVYLLATHRGPSVAVAAAFLLHVSAAGLGQWAPPWATMLHSGLAWAVAWFAGDRTRLRREQIATLVRDADRERQLAVAEERARIARDLHDTAGHAISLIAVRAGAARLRHPQQPGRALPALTAIEELARHTAAEIDQIVGALRDDAPGEVESPHGRASLPAVLDQVTATGHRVRLDTGGTPRVPPPAVDRAAFRIVQEAVSNAVRHGTDQTRITLSYGLAGLEITVTNPVAGTGGAPAGRGHGLVGMRERATLLGGSLDAGRRGAEFRVHARLPGPEGC